MQPMMTAICLPTLLTRTLRTWWNSSKEPACTEPTLPFGGLCLPEEVAPRSQGVPTEPASEAAGLVRTCCGIGPLTPSIPVSLAWSFFSPPGSVLVCYFFMVILFTFSINTIPKLCWCVIRGIHVHRHALCGLLAAQAQGSECVGARSRVFFFRCGAILPAKKK